jgi:hypothetical protein
MLSFLFFISCSGGETKTNNNSNCAEILDTRQRNSCLHKKILTMPASNVAEIIETAKLINDPMIRGAAVSEWVKNHNNDVNQQQGQQLCSLLDGRDRSYCLRRLSSPHLRRE